MQWNERSKRVYDIDKNYWKDELRNLNWIKSKENENKLMAESKVVNELENLIKLKNGYTGST